MSGAYPRTLNLDTLFVNTIIYKNTGNKPPPANQIFASDGTGGTYFEYYPSTISTAQKAINEIDAPLENGGMFKYIANNPYNIFSLSNGAGMQFYSNNVAGQPQLVIYNTGPEQIVADGQTLSFSSLQDEVVGGRTLNYVGTGGVSLSVSGPTIYFNSVETSTLSTLTELVSTNLYVETTLSTLIYTTNSSIANINILYISSGLETLNSTFNDKFNFINNISSYFLQPNAMNVSTISTTNLTIHKNRIQDFPLVNSLYDPCIVYAGSTLISTNTDFLTFTDSFTNATFAIDKEYMYAVSSFNGSTLVTQGQQVQLGWFPHISTQGLTTSMRSQFVPFSQQIQVLEQLVRPNNTSTTTNYYIRNIAKFDEICTSNNFVVNAPALYVSSIYVSSFNGSQFLPIATNFGEYLYFNGNAWIVGGENNIKLGYQSGSTLQGAYAVAVGTNSGESDQGIGAVALGADAGQVDQGMGAVALGLGAGQNNQGIAAVALGYYAGRNNQAPNSIVINASGVAVNPPNAGLFVSPVRLQAASGLNSLAYNATTSEIVYDTNKTFVIQHPKTESKYLVHACLEGPEAGVYYRGKNKIQEGQTSVVITLPDYVSVLATNFTIHVSPVFNGTSRFLNHSEIENNQFRVYGPPGDFHWHVYGLRQEIIVEPDKSSANVQGEGPYRWIA